MKEIKTEIIINAAPEKVWSILTNFEDYPNWNPFISYISGEKEVGSKLNVSINPPGDKGMTFKPTLLKFEKSKEFRWKGKVFIKGLFDGEHFFVLSKTDNNKTKLIQGEKFSGILVPIFGKTLDKTKEGFKLMNESLKNESEK
ncbi:SRPBCC family protein [Vagococcus fluvialis]|uniref:SRPBCC family protein n=1 Tax=Vagococcus fluvialis TaxID=2738 RepID=UPI003B21A94C